MITAALIWYDERPEDLDRCVRGAANIADRFVAVDGAYARYPGAQIASPPEQADAIRSAALDEGMEVRVIIPDRLWAGQIEKRSHLMAEASKRSDWIAVVDADWVISADRDAARAELESIELDVVTVPFFTPEGEGEAATGWHRKAAGAWSDQEHIFRSLPGLMVEGRHYQYSALKDGERVWMWHGPDRSRRVLPKHRLQARYSIEHRCFYRTEQQALANRAYCNDRDMVMRLTGQEDDMPGLPRPAFDYETVPY